MPDKKLINSVIKSALEGAILNSKRYDCKVWAIEVYKLENALDLITHLQEENDTLKEFIVETRRCDKEIKSEAVKEFAEKLKKKCYEDFEETDEMLSPYVTDDDIDNLLKEMVGE